MRSEWRLAPWLLALAVAVPAAAAQAPEEPLLAGSEGVPVPQRVKFVQPVYPPAAAARGLRGIVILSLIVDEQGRVADVEVVRSVPPFDEAAIAAVEQWAYEPTEIDGRPVRVRITVPISFLMKLPEVARQEGIPELRSGAIPPFPPETRQTETVSAEVTLAPDGQVASAEVLEGNPPWTESVIAAVRTWRFDDNDLGPGVQMSFRVEAQFLPDGDGDQRVALQLTGLRRSETVSRAADVAEPDALPAAAGPEPAPPAEEPVAETAEEAPETADDAGTEPAAAEPAAAEPAAAEPAPEAESPEAAAEPTAAPEVADAEPVAPEAGSEGAAEPETAGDESAPAEETAAPPSEPQAAGEDAETPPAADAEDVATEVLGGSPDPAAATEPPLPEEPGVSAVRGVFLEPGVPDLSEGRRPTVPPFARMQGVEGEVRVRFAVDAAGQSFVSAVEGPEELRPAARATVESWLFSRESARRLYLLAELSYDATTATAVVKRER